MRKSPVLLLALLGAMLLAGCNPSGSGDGATSGGASTPPPARQARVDNSQLLARAAYVAEAKEAEARFTLNNPWTAQDMLDIKLDPVGWRGTPASLRWQGLSRRTYFSQYDERLRQCEIDSLDTYANRYPGEAWEGIATFRICYPKLVNETPQLPTDPGPPPVDCAAVVRAVAPINQPGPRYGYWCGAGHPPIGSLHPRAPEPLDAVDFCCMLHDTQVWGKEDEYSYPDPTGNFTRNSPTERGMAMCLYMATQYPSQAYGDDTDPPTVYTLPDVEKARQFWYGCAALASDNNQPDDVQFPRFDPR